MAYGEVFALVFAVFLLLAAGAFGAGAVSGGLVVVAAFSDFGVCCGWGFRVGGWDSAFAGAVVAECLSLWAKL